MKYMNQRLMVKPYIRLFCRLGGFNVWIVDGNYIRDHIDIEFTNFGQHYGYGYIPMDEFWIDKENCHDEEHFFIAHMLVENRLMAAGKSYNFARQKGKVAEKKERYKSKAMKKMLKIKQRKETLDKIHKKLLHDANRVKIWLVDGEIVRDLYYLDFTEGGHGEVYHFVPKYEVWIDDDLKPSERGFVILHELHERNLMANKGYDYIKAHTSSSKIEYRCRHNTPLLEGEIQKELRKAEMS